MSGQPGTQISSADREIMTTKESAARVCEEAAKQCSCFEMPHKILLQCAVAIRALPDADGWQPIDTAPKDGTEIILARDDRVTSGFWMNEVEVMGSEFHSTGAYLGQYPTGEIKEAGWAGWMSQDGGFTGEQPPTHWHPLPKPPETQR